MKAQEIKDEWIHLEENDPPPDLSREGAAFERERPRLVRDHLGKIALIHGDEVVGVFGNVDAAVAEGHRLFGWARLIFWEITATDEPEFIPHVDVNHPSFQRLDSEARGRMAKYIAPVEVHLILPALVSLTAKPESLLQRAGRQVPAPVPVRLLIDTGSKRTTLVPGVISHLDPPAGRRVNVITPLAAGATWLYWVRLAFPGTGLAPFPHVQVARLEMPPGLSQFHGLLGRDLLRQWAEFLYAGQGGYYALRDAPGLFGRLRRWL